MSGHIRNFVGTALLSAMLLLGAPASFAQVSLGIRIGPPPRPRVIRVQPARPGPEYFWVDGYWYPVGRHYQWHEGYWTRPPYEGAHWVGPRYDGGSTLKGTGKGIVAGLRTTTAGTGIETEITVGSAITITATTIATSQAAPLG
jgi:hypothetical protein